MRWVDWINIKYHIHQKAISQRSPILCGQNFTEEHIQYSEIHISIQSGTRHRYIEGGCNGLEPAGGLCKLLQANSYSFPDAAEEQVQLSVHCQTGNVWQTWLLTASRTPEMKSKRKNLLSGNKEPEEHELQLQD